MHTASQDSIINTDNAPRQAGAPSRTCESVAKLGFSQSVSHGANWKIGGDRLSGAGEHKELFVQLAKQNETKCNYLMCLISSV